MTEPDEPAVGETPPDDSVFDDVREAAGEVVSSLKRLIDATERVVEDPEAFAGIVEGGRSVVEAFLGGFSAQAGGETGADSEPNAESDEPVPES